MTNFGEAVLCGVLEEETLRAAAVSSASFGQTVAGASVSSGQTGAGAVAGGSSSLPGPTTVVALPESGPPVSFGQA